MPHSLDLQRSSVHSTAFRRLAWGLLVASWACALVSIGLSLARWAAIGHAMDWGRWLPVTVVPAQAMVAGVVAPATMDAAWRWLGVALECIPGLALLYTVLCVHRICRAFLRGEVFGPEVVRGFRGVGWGFLAMFVASLVYQVGVSAMLSWLASGQKGGMVVLSVSSFEMSVLVVGLMMLLLAHVLAEGSRLKAESDAFV
ncbi:MULTISPECIES: DUF2975 domain-containing protein [unclassified Acidovorax]|uniref:DUF2975 domain-containing protein n=1 Tax=unclassified Acidovorax TaxID=2684926 RepID=UPI002106CA7C|nr:MULTISPECIES: DUF2975 domain-containing protein [unclassified Acidovorax]